jgi:hypothetical protein
MKKMLLFITLFWTVGLMHAQQLTNIPTIYVTTDDGIDPWSKTTWQAGRIAVESSDITEKIDTIMKIRGRGNSTWNAAKKPYRIKLDKKHKLLNNSAKAKDWVLLANDFDKTLIRNAVAFKISELAGFAFSPSARFVDLVLNGKYAGNYMLTDQIEVHSSRVNIAEEDGSYLVEVDGFASSEDWWFKTGKGMNVSIHYPDEKDITETQYFYIDNFTQQFEDALFSTDFTNLTTGYKAWVDTASLINWYVASELTGNPDCFWSTYMYKPHNEDKFYFGPLWDFDIAFNNDSRLGDATQKLMRDNAHEPRTWIRQLWKDDWFKRAVYRRWQELRNDGILNQLLNYIDETAALISASQIRNENKWHKVNGSYQSQINTLKNYVTARVDFLTTSFDASNPPLPPEPSQPFVPSDFYYMLMNVNTNNVVEVSNAALGEGAPLFLVNPKKDDYELQRWVFKPVDTSITYDEGYYQLFNAYSGMVVAGNGRDQNLIQTLPDLTDYAQMWKVVPVLTGNIYGLVNLASGYSMNNKAGNTAEGTPVIEYDNRITQSANQQWYLKPMEEIAELPGYPNVENTTGIAIVPNGAKRYLSCALYNLQGVCIYSDNYNASTMIVLSRLNLPKGIYILKMNGEDGTDVRKIRM